MSHQVGSTQIGLTDTILGLVAIACEKKHKQTGDEYAGFTFGELCDALHDLQHNPQYESLHHLDFEHLPGGWYSRALETTFFLAGWGGLIQSRVITGRSILTVGSQQAKKRIARLKRDYGDNTMSRLETMADDLIENTTRHNSYLT